MLSEFFFFLDSVLYFMETKKIKKGVGKKQKLVAFKYLKEYLWAYLYALEITTVNFRIFKELTTYLRDKNRQ